MNENVSTDAWIGARLGERYLIRTCLARGSMGSVYLAVHEALGREVAVKVLDVKNGRTVQDSRGDNRDRKRFIREASLLARLTHPNTVRVFDYGLHEETPYLVMEYVRGDTLQDVLKHTPRMEPLRAIRIARQVCASLSEAHELGLVHRDLKPANMLITKDFDGSDMVKVVDFGLVKEVRDAVHMTGDGVMIGTPVYMSPEQIRGRPLDQRVDVYALGVVLYRMLLGRPPFAEEQTAAVLVAHITDPPPPFASLDPSLSLPAAVEWTVQRCLEKDPAQRFDSSRTLARALKVCEAALLDAGMATSAQIDLIEGRASLPPELGVSMVSSVIDVRTVERRRRETFRARMLGAGAATAALIAALAFGFVAVKGLLAWGDADATDAVPMASPAPEPTPPPAPVGVPDPTPEPAPPALEPEPEPMPSTPKPTATPKPSPAPRPTAQPAPKRQPQPTPAPSPTSAPKPKPTNGSDLEDPWATPGDDP